MEVGNTVKLLVLNFSSVSAILLLPATEINESLEAIGEISHAENMEYSSDAHSSQPATATQVLLTNLGVCLRGVGEQASILGPLTLTLLPFSWMASLDTFLFSYIFFKSLSIFSF